MSIVIKKEVIQELEEKIERHEINKVFQWVGNLTQSEGYFSTIATRYDEQVEEINELLEEVNTKIQELYFNIENGE